MVGPLLTLDIGEFLAAIFVSLIIGLIIGFILGVYLSSRVRETIGRVKRIIE